MQQLEMYLLSTTTWRQDLVLASWIYQRPGREIFLVDANCPGADLTHLSHLAKAQPMRLFDVGMGDESWRHILRDLSVTLTETAADAEDMDSLVRCFGQPQGIVLAPADSYSACLKAAVLAIRLGWVMMPWVDDGPGISNMADLAQQHSCVALDSGLKPFWEQSGLPPEVVRLRTEEDCCRFLEGAGQVIDYILTVNSCDIETPQAAGSSLSEGWVRGLSLLAVTMASYRKIFLLDARQARPDPAVIEQTANQLVAQLAIDPLYHGILASPGAVPLMYGPRLEMDYCCEETVRDLYIRLGNGLHHTVAGGRLFQRTAGGMSRQILNTKYYGERIGSLSENVLLVTTPATQKVIIFESDLPLIQAKLQPLLTEAGYATTLLAGVEASQSNLAQQLTQAGMFLYTGHGSAESINTCAGYLQPDDLPDLPPMTIFASACSTTGLRPYWLSASSGLDYQRDELPAEGQIALAMLEKGAVAFVGSATCADFQFTESTYGIFMEALLIEGASVGEALNATRNFVIDYLTLLRQGAPESYNIAKESAAAMIHQQILFGDPAHRPYPKAAVKPPYRWTMPESGDAMRIHIEIPAASWRNQATAVPNQSESYYRCRQLEVVSPAGAGMVVWGDFFNIYLGEQETAWHGAMSSFVYVKCPVPAGFAPGHLRLDRATGYREGLAGQGPMTRDAELATNFQRFRLPFLMMPPLQLDFSAGYPFAVEHGHGAAYVRFLVPALVFDEGSLTRIKAEELEFTLSLQPVRQVRGCVAGPADVPDGEFLLTACASDHGEVAQATVRQNVPFVLDCAASARLLKVEGQLAVQELPQRLQPLGSVEAELDFTAEMILQPPLQKLASFQGRVAAARTLQPLAGAVIRIWRGVNDPNGYPLREGFVAELTSQGDGSFAAALPPGDYLCYCAAKDQGRQFMLREEAVKLLGDEPFWLNLLLEEAALVQGRVSFLGGRPPYPAVTLEAMGTDHATLATAQVDAGGDYVCPVPSDRRFRLVVEKEGWHKIVDDNDGAGYYLEPGARLQRDYSFHRNYESGGISDGKKHASAQDTHCGADQ